MKKEGGLSLFVVSEIKIYFFFVFSSILDILAQGVPTQIIYDINTVLRRKPSNAAGYLRLTILIHDAKCVSILTFLSYLYPFAKIVQSDGTVSNKTLIMTAIVDTPT